MTEVIKLTDPRWPEMAAKAGRVKPQRGSKRVSEREDTGAAGPWKFTVYGAPVGKPRQSQRDKWQKRPCVMKARAWADAIRHAMPADLPPRAGTLHFIAYMPFPKSYSKELRAALAGKPHTLKPDKTNLEKLIEDSLFEHDECIHSAGEQRKVWDDGKGARVEITVER